MQYKPGNWVTGFKRSPRAANVQNRDMGLFLNSSGKFEPIDDSWDNLHSGGMFISGTNKIYFRDETNKDIYINSPAAETLGLSAGNATTAGFVTINEEGFDTDFRVEASGVTHALFVQGSDGNVGIGEPSPANLLHVKVDDVGIAPHGSSQIALERDGTNYLQFLTANTGTSGLLFGDTADVDVAKIVYDHNVPNMVFTTEAVTTMNIDGSTGAITKPVQPAFSATVGAAQDDIAIDTEVTIVLGTEIFDQGADFATNTFTAPVTGRYQLSANVLYANIDSAANWYWLNIKTSNREYRNIYSPLGLDQDITYKTFTVSILADMDASDTAYITFQQDGGTQQTDIINSASYASFSGHLAC